MAFETLEQAQERILELEEQVRTMTETNNSLTGENETLKNDIESVRALNQKYFNKLIAQEESSSTDNEEPDVPSCEEFAKTLKI